MATPAIEFADVTKVYQRRFAGGQVPALANVVFCSGSRRSLCLPGAKRRGQDNQHEYPDGIHLR
ncbi:MAG TPA: hypothetical protein VGK36_13210 [Candidatus Angelobacter sp.]